MKLYSLTFCVLHENSYPVNVDRYSTRNKHHQHELKPKRLYIPYSMQAISGNISFSNQRAGQSLNPMNTFICQCQRENNMFPLKKSYNVLLLDIFIQWLRFSQQHGVLLILYTNTITCPYIILWAMFQREAGTAKNDLTCVYFFNLKVLFFIRHLDFFVIYSDLTQLNKKLLLPRDP